MIRRAKQALFWITTVFLLALVLFVYKTVHFRKIELSDTKLGGLNLSTYVYSVRKLDETSNQNGIGVSFSPKETSFLLEQISPRPRYGYFRVVDWKVRSNGELAGVQFILDGPLGSYIHCDFSGSIHYQSENGGWTVKPRSVAVGDIPVTWFLSSSYHPDWPNKLEDGKVTIDSLQLDGKGLRAKVTSFDYDVDDLVD